MRRFLIKVKHTPEEDTSPHSVDIEGVVFSDGFIVIHGSFFHGVHVASLDELGRIVPHSDIKWIDEDENHLNLAEHLPPVDWKRAKEQAE